MNQPPAYVLVLTTNLATFSQIQHAAQAQGFSVLWGQSIENALPKIPPGCKVDFLVVDLSEDRFNCAEIKTTMSLQYPDTILIAFGPHVHETRLNKALEAGFQQVMARGRFFHILGEIFSPE